MNGRNKVIGVFSHVDAGKTTLIEALLYQAKVITALGNVNKGTTFMDSEPIERQRGITFSSKPVHFKYQDQAYTIIDTPGHMDLTFEMEKSLQVVDIAILLVSAAEGITGYTETIYQLCQQYNVPVLFFYNKLDMVTTSATTLMADLNKLAPAGIQYQTTGAPLQEQVDFFDDWAMFDDTWFNYLMAHEQAELAPTNIKNQLGTAILQRTIMPVVMGSARQVNGIAELLTLLDAITLPSMPVSDEGIAQVYKISHDDKQTRYVHVKVISGSFQPKNKIHTNADEAIQKINQIFTFQGGQYQPVNQANPGDIIAITGLDDLQPGQFFAHENVDKTVIPSTLTLKREAVLTVRVLAVNDENNDAMVKDIQLMAAEDPTLKVNFKPEVNELYIHVTGKLQLEYLKITFQERFGFDIEFSAPTIIYQETITAPVIGYGHYEPLRHYAAVALKLEPGQRGQGIKILNECSSEQLDRNYQKRIIQHIQEKVHLGVLTGASITDITVTLLSGQAYVPETKGGDFREATYRAIRQGLMKTTSQLLEPWYQVQAIVPIDLVGRVSSDLEKLGGRILKLDNPNPESALVIGEVPVANFLEYPIVFASFSKNEGRLTTTLKGYFPCKNQDQLIAASDYNPETDLDNTPNSIFFKKGRGFDVSWREVDELHQLYLG